MSTPPVNLARVATEASASSAPPAPLIAPTGNTSVDALASAVNSGAQPFQDLGNPKAGTLDRISDVVNGAVGSLGAFDQLLNTGMALIPGANLMPGMPAAFIGVPHLGVPHAHAHPPSNGVPLPSFGETIGSGCLSVLYGGMPAARVLDVGMAPTCGGLAPIFEISTGSSNTFIGGARAARMAIDLTRHCNPLGVSGKGHVAEEAEKASGFRRAMNVAGVAAPVVAGGATAADQAIGGRMVDAAMTAAQTAADAMAMALSNLMGKDPGVEPGMGTLLIGNPSVLIGGFPMPDALAMLMLGWGLRKKAKAKDEGEEPKRTNEEPCKDGHPVDVVTGAAENEFVDFSTSATPAFKWERYYCSAWNDQDGPLGYGFRHAFQHELRLLRTRAVYVDSLNRAFPIRRDDMGRYEGVFAGCELEQQSANRFVMRQGERGEFTFERASESQRSARLVRHVREGVESTLRYASDGALHQIEQASGRDGRRRLIDFVYEVRNHVTEVNMVDAQGAVSCIARYRYDRAGCLVASTDALGASMTYGYDSRRRMIRETDANGYAFSYRYDSNGRCVESAGQDGLWRVLLDYQPGRTVVTRADGGKWSFLYNASQTVTRILDPYGGVTERVLGGDGRVACEVDSGGRVMDWLYDRRGGNTGRLDQWANRWPTRQEAPALPNARALEVPATPLAQQWGKDNSEDMPDRMLLPPEIEALAASVAAPACTVCTPKEQHDAVGRVVVRTDERGNAEHLHRDAEGNLVRLRDKDGRDYRYTIASWNLRESETDPTGHTVRYRYTAKAAIAAIIDANGNESAYTYDLKGRIASVTRHGRLRETYRYDAGDRLIEKRDGQGNRLLQFEVGEHGLHSKRILAGGETHHYEYDERGNFTKASTDKFDILIDYDEEGRRIGDKRDGSGVDHGYFEGRLASTTWFDRFVVRYDLVALGETLIRTPVGGRHRLLRSNDGRVYLRLGNGLNLLCSFDAAGRCTGRLVWRDGPTEAVREARGIRYQYSAMGELQRVIDSEAGTTEYQYDAAHRLVGETREGWPVRRFQYDAAGNLLWAPDGSWMRHSEGNRLADTSSGVFHYNERNHLAQGIAADGCRTTWRYNSLDLLVRVEWSDRPEVWSAEYDGLCRRITTRMGDACTQYYWDGNRPGAEVGPDGRVRLYLYVNETALLPFMFIDYAGLDAAPESGRACFVLCNQAGLPERIVDCDGQTVWLAEDIDPYGMIRVAAGNSIDYALRWPGHYYDRDTSLHYNRFRSYHPGLGRYLQSDPAGQSGGINLYAYVANPLVQVDVLGLRCPNANHPDDCDEKGYDHEYTGPPEDAAALKPDRLPDKTKIPCFNPYDKSGYKNLSDNAQRNYLESYAKQLRAQQRGINKMTADEFKAARDAFDQTAAQQRAAGKKNPSGRNPAGAKAQREFRKGYGKKIRESIFEDILNKNPSLTRKQALKQARERSEEIMGTLAALHNPDMVAGGWHHYQPEGMGALPVNSSIGSSWNNDARLDTLENAARAAVAAGQGGKLMNVVLRLCRGDGKT
ncbi:hypothetical protein LMG28688_02444 [Paraburkholderia caffeinitolerans]|uniref:Uncharacterized protein n=1 Tax=Paraburkholderia caffeinitolerans TaxID=1723730 RepID=A0A6J5FXD2_9BURK|nr:MULTISPECIES: polymorphic toxin type 15 domain-containing protein [Paraburkholderia]CAB3787329.1 hypothetical protein LMG28688_02444 [Paraburkholderia caffeinitolerans]